MGNQTLVIGLGQLGMSFARAMSEQGSEVIAVDVDPLRVHEVASAVAEAVELNATDADALARLSPHERDVCLCAVGDENREASIIITALLKQLNAPHIIARAINPIHARILRLVGAHEVINPEQSYGERLALRLMWRGALNILPLGGGLVLTELVAPEGMLGRTLAELELPRRFSVTVAALRERGAPAAPGEALSPAAAAQLPARLPEPHRPLQRGDVLLLVGAEPHTRLLVERFQ
ncbi:MAG: TrkA family potassium uptake protein [Deltaproteobacteria bacterium]|nr:TrkA family potassium uptake protein [Deltaproteobacteria bacterium]